MLERAVRVGGRGGIASRACQGQTPACRSAAIAPRPSALLRTLIEPGAAALLLPFSLPASSSTSPRTSAHQRVLGVRFPGPQKFRNGIIARRLHSGQCLRAHLGCEEGEAHDQDDVDDERQSRGRAGLRLKPARDDEPVVRDRQGRGERARAGAGPARTSPGSCVRAARIRTRAARERRAGAQAPGLSTPCTPSSRAIGVKMPGKDGEEDDEDGQVAHVGTENPRGGSSASLS